MIKLLHIMVEDKSEHKCDLNIHNQKNIVVFCLFLTGRNSVDTKRQSCLCYCGTVCMAMRFE